MPHTSIGSELATTTTTHRIAPAPGEDWLRKLASERRRVSCQLLARRIYVEDSINNNNTKRSAAAPSTTTTTTDFTKSSRSKKRPIPGLDIIPLHAKPSSSFSSSQIAVGRVFFRPRPFQLIPTDVGQWMVQRGLAVPSQDGGMYPHADAIADRTIVDGETDPQQFRRQHIRYMNELVQAEYAACAGSYGIWSNPLYRTQRRDVVEEVEFQQTANALQKLWRWIRHGG
jgi:hypothetical protein